MPCKFCLKENPNSYQFFDNDYIDLAEKLAFLAWMD